MLQRGREEGEGNEEIRTVDKLSSKQMSVAWEERTGKGGGKGSDMREMSGQVGKRAAGGCLRQERGVKARDVREEGKDTEDTNTQKRSRIKENEMVVWKGSTTYRVSIVKERWC